VVALVALSAFCALGVAFMIYVLIGMQRALNSERRANTQGQPPQVIFKTLVEMRHSGLMALKARFRIRHKP
jgi:hypothetical protein